MAVVSISVPEELLEEMDNFAEDHGYSGRSELLRESARSLMGEFEDSKLEGRDLVATVTVIFEFENSDVESEMIEMRHGYEDRLRSNVHSHIGDEYCMELFVIEGSLEDLRDFVGSVRSTNGVLSINYSVNPIDDLT
jgi:Predicted transcriptional regulators containing the CopG/Arc/MetJ DNA-binding domain and a metal-binding domain